MVVIIADPNLSMQEKVAYANVTICTYSTYVLSDYCRTPRVKLNIGGEK